MLNNGAQMSHVQAVLGHQSLATTSRIYARHDVKNLRDAFDRYSGRLCEQPDEKMPE
jgi:site-specific recombinase XerD